MSAWKTLENAIARSATVCYPKVTLELKAKLDFLKRTKQDLYADLP